jgi:hypothetical protein
LRAGNIAYGWNRVARIRRKYQISAHPPRRSVRTTGFSRSPPMALNLLEQKFTEEEPSSHCAD